MTSTCNFTNASLLCVLSRNVSIAFLRLPPVAYDFTTDSSAENLFESVKFVVNNASPQALLSSYQF